MPKAITLSMMLFLFMGSCRKVPEHISADNFKENIPFTFEEAIGWFQSGYGEKHDTASDAQKSKKYRQQHLNSLFPKWKMAISSADPNYYVVDCPLGFGSLPGMKIHRKGMDNSSNDPNLRSRLLVMKDKKNERMRGAVMYIHCKGGADTSITYQNRKNFSGSIFFISLKGKFINGWEYSQGKITGKITEPPKEKNTGLPFNPQGLEDPGDYGPGDCQYILVNWYERTCYYGDGNQLLFCTEWTYLYTEEYEVCDFEGGGGDDDGSCGGPGGSGYIEHEEEVPQPDPCDVPAAEAANTFSMDLNFITAKAQILLAAADGNEHGISFGKDDNGNTLVSAMSTGNAYSGTLNPVQHQFADLHNHPDDAPPSAGDVYEFLDNVLSSAEYKTKYVVTNSGDVYALVLTDVLKAQAFNQQYPRVQIGNYPPDFPDPPFTDSDNARIYLEYHGLSHTEAAANALAFLLTKYNTGIAILKMDSAGQFKKLRTKESEENGNMIYTTQNCL